MREEPRPPAAHAGRRIADAALIAAMPEAGTNVCPFCKGSGRCHKCAGTGRHTHHGRGLRREKEVACGVCQGTGTCDLCHGTGRRTDTSEG